jgi:alcohol dehydrogenase class IV
LALGKLCAALGQVETDPAAVPGLVEQLASRAGAARLGELGVERGQLREAAAAAARRPELAAVPDSPSEGELLELLERAY